MINLLLALTIPFFSVHDEQAKEGPFNSGMKARSTTRSPSAGSVKSKYASSATVKSKGNATFMGKSYHKDDGTVVGGKASSTASVAKSVAAGSFCGKPVPQDGAFGEEEAPRALPYSLFLEIAKVVGGAGVLVSATPWTDSRTNKRGSLHLALGSFCVVPEDGIDVRLSTVDPSVVVTQYEVSKEFTDPKTVLDYVYEIIEVECPHLNSRRARWTYLQGHPRYTALYGAIKKLRERQGKNYSKAVRFELRIKFFDEQGKPFNIANTLVQKSEDNIFFGLHTREDKHGATHIHMQFKERGATFAPVDHSGKNLHQSGSFGMSPIQECDDDDSDDDDFDFKIPSHISTPMKKAMHRGSSKASKAEASAMSYRETSVVSSAEEEEEDNSSISSKENDMEFEDADDGVAAAAAAAAEVSYSTGGLTEEQKIAKLTRQFNSFLRAEMKEERNAKKRKNFFGAASIASRGERTRTSESRDGKRKSPKSKDNEVSSSKSKTSKRSSKSKESIKSARSSKKSTSS